MEELLKLAISQSYNKIKAMADSVVKTVVME